MLLPVPRLDNNAFAFNPSSVEIESVDTEEVAVKVNFVQTYTAEHLDFVSLHYKTANNEEVCESQIEVSSGDIMSANLKCGQDGAAGLKIYLCDGDIAAFN